MSFESIKKHIDNNINEAIKLINDLNKKINNVKFTKTQLNIKIIDTDIIKKSDEIRIFINTYKKLFEENKNIYQRIFTEKNIYLSDDFLNLLQTMSNNLSNFKENNNNIIDENFNNRNRDLNEDEKNNLEQDIKNDLSEYDEDKKKLIKEYERRNNELLNIIISYLNTFILLKKNIYDFGLKIEECFNEVESHEFFKNKYNLIEEKHKLVDPYIKINLLKGEIDELFSNIEILDEDRISQNPFNKLKRLNQSIEKKFNSINEKIRQIRKNSKKDQIEFQNINIGIDKMNIINNDLNDLVNKIKSIHTNIKNEYKKLELEENKYRLDFLIIIDTTSSMGYYLEKVQKEIKIIIDSMKNNFPEFLIYIGFIGYKDIIDLDLGDDYVDIDFTINHKIIQDKINKIEPDGGDDIPEDVAGAFELALEKTWKGNFKIAVLITDSPCHGKEFYDLEINDNYLNEEVPDREKIKDLIHKFKRENISLICLNLHNRTKKMFDIFKNEYNQINSDLGNFFLITKKLSDKEIIQNISKLFNLKLIKYIEEDKKKKDQKNMKNQKDQKNQKNQKDQKNPLIESSENLIQNK